MDSRTIAIVALILAFGAAACRDAVPEPVPPPVPPRTKADAGRALELLAKADAAVSRGDYAVVLGCLHEVIEIYQQLNMKEEEANVWAALAAFYMQVGSDENAQTALDRGRELAQRSGHTDALKIIDAFARMRALMARKAPVSDVVALYEELCRFSKTACTQAEATPADIALAQQSGALFAMGRFEEGRALVNDMLKRTFSHDLRALYYYVLGGSYVMERKAEPAIDEIIRAVGELEIATEMLRRDDLIESYVGDRKVYAEVLVELLAGQGRVEEALSFAERARGRAFLQMIGNRRIHPHDEQLAAETEALRAAAETASPGELLQARTRYRELLARVKSASPEYSSMIDIEPLDLRAMQQEIPDGTTIVVYFVNTTTAHAWLLERTRLDYVKLAAEPRDLKRAVCWAQALPSRAGEPRAVQPVGTDCDDAMTADEAYAALVGPLVPHLRNNRLIVVPHGLLHYIPFAALRNPQTKHYLVEDYVLTYAPSVSALRFLRAKASPFEGRALVIGNPEHAGARPLPGTKNEAKAIAGLLDTVPHLGSEARGELLYNAAGKYDLIHIGAHGEYNATSPLFSRLVLAPGASRDGSLEVHEILSDVDLDGVNLVILSSCSSGRGTPSGGDEIVGLTRAIHYAGSPAVISTLWDIDDEATVSFMQELYGRFRAGAPVADAVREAQLSLLRRAPYRDPAFWAAFTLSGSSGSLMP